MVEWWMITIGFLICLGLAGGLFVYAISRGLTLSDASRIDPIPEDENEEK